MPISALLEEDSASSLIVTSPGDLNGGVLLNLVLYITSNNFPGEFSPAKIYDLVREPKNTHILDSLLSREDATAEAAVEKLFRCAVEAGDVSVVKHFLGAGLNPSGHTCCLKDITDQLTPMQYACITRDAAMVEVLINAGSTIDELGSGWKSSALVLAISGAYYLGLHGQVPLNETYEQVDRHGLWVFSPDSCSDIDKDTEKEQFFEDLDASAKLHRERRMTELANDGRRVAANLLRLVSILIDAGASINPLEPLHSPVPDSVIRNGQNWLGGLYNDGHSPLTAASQFRQNAIVALLIREGADVSFVTHNSKSALQKCLYNWRESKLLDGQRLLRISDCKWSIERGDWFDSVFNVAETLPSGSSADSWLAPGHEDDGGGSPLTLAISSHGTDVIELLLSAGATLEQKHLIAAFDRKESSLLKFILSTGIQPDRQTAQYIITHLKSTDDWPEPIEGLLHLHQDTKLRELAAICAIELGDLALWELLLQHGDIGASIFSEDNPNITQAVESCCKSSKTDVLCRILDPVSLAGRSIGPLLGCAIHATLLSNKASIDYGLVQMLLAAGADVNARSINNETALFIAVRRRDASLVDRLIVAGADVNAQSTSGATALLQAVAMGKRSLVEKLLDFGAASDTEVTCECFIGGFPRHTASGDILVTAIERGDRSIIKLLVERSSRLSEPGSDWTEDFQGGFSRKGRCKMPLTLAILKNQWGVVHHLLKKGAAVDPTDISTTLCLSSAITSRNNGLVQWLLAAGAHPGHPRVLQCAFYVPKLFSDLISRLRQHSTIPVRANLGGGALAQAIESRNPEMVKMVLDSKTVDVNSSPDQHFDLWGTLYPHLPVELRASYEYRWQNEQISSEVVDFTPLQSAVCENSCEILRLLLKNGADPESVSPGNSDTPLQYAASEGHKPLVDVLIEYGADTNAPAAERGGRTALQYAAEEGYLGIAFTLLENSANPNAPGADGGGTALELAACNGRIDMVQMLLNAGAEVHGEGEAQYKRALRYATWNGHLALRKLLEEYHG